MTDRELLELAAKAAGIEGRRCVENEPIQANLRTGMWCDLLEDVWNPLTNDVDAFRLAVDLCIDIKPGQTKMSAWCHSIHDWLTETVVNDKYATLRKVIVLAGAEIGKTMP